MVNTEEILYESDKLRIELLDDVDTPVIITHVPTGDTKTLTCFEGTWFEWDDVPESEVDHVLDTYRAEMDDWFNSVRTEPYE